MKVAIVGGGPRGLWAAEELLFRAERLSVPVDLTVFESGNLGEGSAYYIDQPRQWRINANSAIIKSHVGSFDDWREDSSDPFPPRAQVGEFFAYSWRKLAERFPFTVIHARAELDHLTDFDQVLIATGHAPTWPGALKGAISAYPASNLAAITPGSHVAIRGASLTFIDVALYLSALPEDQRPARVTVHSRSGRFMEVKPNPGEGPDITAQLAEGDRRIRLCEDFTQFRQILINTAASLRPGLDEDLITSIIDGTDYTGDSVAELRRSVAMDFDEHWAVGATWRGLYPAICYRTSFGRRADLTGFHELSRTLERVAFGPPAVNAAKILELIDSGFIDTSIMTQDVETVGADHIVDAVLSPQGLVPDTLTSQLVSDTVTTDHAGFIAPGWAVVGRDTEDHVLGNDTLSRTLHDVIPRWAEAVLATAPASFDRGVHATVPLTARLEHWEAQLSQRPDQAQEIVEKFGSPTNVLNPAPMGRNIAELVNAGADHGVTVKVFYARKANKGLCFVDEVLNTGHGVDVASERELRQVLGRGMPADRIILSAAIKPDALLELAVSAGVPLSVDSTSEMRRIARIAAELGTVAKVAPRLAPDPSTMPPTRFGERLSVWQDNLPAAGGSVAVVGAHAHMHGYDEKDRRFALNECVQLLDTAREQGHHPEFVDLGGGVPMSYLDDGSEWEAFNKARAEHPDTFTWKGDPLKNTYPFHQSPTRGAWLSTLLCGAVGDVTGAEALISRGLRLHLEPGRSILDGCGMILADVAFVKKRADGLPLVGLAMNRTQCRTNTDDILLDPILIRTDRDIDPESAWNESVDAFLVGAYCIEDELIIRRKMRFPAGIKAGDIIAIPNTAGYFMHILESASHQIPLAKNVVTSGSGVELDAIDAG